MMKVFLIIIIFSIAACTGSDKKTIVDYDNTPVISNGEILFKASCASCHKVYKDFTGSALKGSLERWGGDKKAMYGFIKTPAN